MQENRHYTNKKRLKKFITQKRKISFRIARELSVLVSRHTASLGLLYIFLPGFISLVGSSQTNVSNTTTLLFKEVWGALSGKFDDINRIENVSEVSRVQALGSVQLRKLNIRNIQSKIIPLINI